MATFLQYGFLTIYSIVLLLLAIYGCHRYHLVYLYYRNRRNQPRPRASFLELPRVTVQLPMYNEQFVARRIIEYTCAIDYPRDRLQIQVLDDSTDETQAIALETVERMAALGHDIVYIHRDNRTGYKAGALDHGLETATGELICIFDADFCPEPDILQRTVHFFTDPEIGMVQARWTHINRDQSMLTKGQAIFLDGHFVIEHAARNRSGRLMSFNGTAGLWRRTCIEDAGGWQHDTLTEDLDLSYRAQLRGWKFVFLPDVLSPAELPPDMAAFKSQQHRWTKGGAQTARKLLPTILRSRLPLPVKIEAFFHLTSWVCYVLMVALVLMLFPAFWVKITLWGDNWWLAMVINFSLFLLATCSASTFYMCSQREIYRDWRDKLKYLPFLMGLGVGISLNNAKGALEALFGKQSEFVRTPKFGASSSNDVAWKANASKVRGKIDWMPWLEFTFGIYLVACLVMSLSTLKLTIVQPFLLVFTFGYFYVSLLSMMSNRVKSAASDPQAEPASEKAAID